MRLCNSPVPGFGAPGGDSSTNYQRAPGTGVGVCNAAGVWEDHAGTSMAAPLVAREAAWVFQELTRHCGGQTIPFAGTVKAWMNLVAKRPRLNGAFEALAKRTLGQGLPTAGRLQNPFAGSAVFIWQSVLQTPKNVSRVQFPVPSAWLANAKKPKLRVVAAWNTPVNVALVDSWACRKVSIKVRPFGAVEALRGGGGATGGYTLVDREFDIRREALETKGFQLSEGFWVLESEYEEIGEYPPAMTVSPQQRVGVVLELWDAAEEARSPQAFVQASAIALELNRLSVLQHPIQAPVTIKQ